MYRGSSFLLQHAYTVHLGVVDVLATPRFAVLWTVEFGAGEENAELVPIVLEAVEAIREEYRPFAPAIDSRQPSDTLITKVLLGTFGCLPACDRYFVDGLKSAGFKYSRLNAKLVALVLDFCQKHLRELCDEQTRIERSGGMHYPLMKLVDMYFWQIGYERGVPNA